MMDYLIRQSRKEIREENEEYDYLQSLNKMSKEELERERKRVFRRMLKLHYKQKLIAKQNRNDGE